MRLWGTFYRLHHILVLHEPARQPGVFNYIVIHASDETKYIQQYSRIC